MPFSRIQQGEAYRRMLRIRRFEEVGIELHQSGRIPGSYHPSIGQEGAIVGACMALRDDDMMTGTHRSHGHPIGKGAHLKALMAELLGKETGVCRGRGGSMHLADNSVGIVGESAIVGGGIPLATGCGLSAKVRETDQVTLCFFGDGAVNQGVFHESLNMASLWDLPVVYFCENNGYAITTSILESHAQRSVAARAAAYAMPSVEVDGQDVAAVFAATEAAVDRARTRGGPTLIEAKTYRFFEHECGIDTLIRDPYRSKDELEEMIGSRDPILIHRASVLRLGMTEADLQGIESEVDQEISEALDFAEHSSLPDPSSLYDYMFCDPILYPDPAPHVQARGHR